jgi:hypothetical protein
MENCAVVVVLDSPTDPDPVYLLKGKEGWRVLPGLTQFQREIFQLDAAELKRFSTLESWYKSQVGK